MSKALTLALLVLALTPGAAGAQIPPPYMCAKVRPPEVFLPPRVLDDDCTPPPGTDYCPYVTVYGERVLLVCVKP